MEVSWRIIYPRGDRTKIAIARVYAYEESDWALVCDDEWEDTDEGRYEAENEMRRTARNRNLQVREYD